MSVTEVSQNIGRMQAHLGYDGLHRINTEALREDLLEADRRRQQRTLAGMWLRWRYGLLGFGVTAVLLEPLSRAGWPWNIHMTSMGAWGGLSVAVLVLAWEVHRSGKVTTADRIDEHVANMQSNLRMYTGPGWIGRTIWDGLKFGAGLGLFVSALVVMGAAEGGAGLKECVRLAALAEAVTVGASVLTTFPLRSRALKRASKYLIRA